MVAAAVGVATAGAAAFLAVPVTVLEVTARASGRLLWRVPVEDGATVDLEYTNSIFNAPTTERFEISDRSFLLVEVSSTQEAVLQYLALDPPYQSRNGRLVSKRQGPTVGELTVRIGQTGQQRLTAGGREIPLYRVGTGEAVRLAISRMRRVHVLLGKPSPP